MIQDIKIFYLDTCLHIVNTAGKDSSGPSDPHAFPGMLGITFLLFNKLGQSPAGFRETCPDYLSAM